MRRRQPLTVVRVAAIAIAILVAATLALAEEQQLGGGRTLVPDPATVATFDAYGSSIFSQPAKPDVSHEALLAEESTGPSRGSLLARLLTWPKKEGDTDEAAAGEEEPLESDRPDITEAPTTVGLGRLQIESGYLYTHGKSGDPTANSHELPQLLLRYGIAERLELRCYFDGIVLDSRRQAHSGRLVEEDGLSDIEFGFKYAATQQDGWWPKMAVLAAVTAPAGSPNQTSGQVDPIVGYLYGWEITKRLSLDAETAATWTAESDDRYSELQQSFSLGFALTEPLHVFGEWAGLFRRHADDSRPQQYFDAGVTCLVSPNVQLDWSAGVGLTAAADRFFTGCGITMRR